MREEVMVELSKRIENLRRAATPGDMSTGTHADCVMLNKGKYLLTVLATLKDILHRSGGHHTKKRYIFRPLRIAERFLG